jgi:hypothetical protein
MEEWKPQWKVDEESRPAESVYVSADGNNYAVIVGPSGIIEVLKDDWLSKYSAAIHGNMFDVEDRYVRLMGRGRYEEIRNIHLIFQGEKIIHLPSVKHFHLWYQKHGDDTPEGLPVVTPPISPWDTDWIDRATTIAPPVLDIVSLILEFLPRLAAAGALATCFSQILFILGAMRDLTQAREVDVRAEAFYASLYASVAWIFDDLHKEEPLVRPTTSLGDHSQFAPQLRFPVPKQVADPNLWYSKLFAFSNRVEHVEKRKKVWEESTNAILDKFEDHLEWLQSWNAGSQSRGPSFTREKFRRESRAIQLPEDFHKPEFAGKTYQLNRNELFEIYYRSFLKDLGSMGNQTDKRLIKSQRRNFAPPVRNSAF